MVERETEHYEEIDELGNRWVYNPDTGFMEFSAPPGSKPVPITDYAY